MALTECWECGDNVSTAAEVCPHCGAPNPAPDIEQGECYGCGQDIEIEKGENCPQCDLHLPFAERPLTGAASLSNGGESGNRSAGSSKTSNKQKSDGLAGLLGFLLGPVGLWYKRQWAAGFAWLAGAFIAGAMSGGFLAPVAWIGMAIHAYNADPGD